MKGVVFTEFYAFVENQHSIEFLQDVIDGANLNSLGAYASTGTYPSCEMAALVASMARKTGLDASILLRVFGEHLFKRFSIEHSEFFKDIENAFEFLATVEHKIHVEVRKLYPDAELPTFEVLEHERDRFRIVYTSSRHLGDFCEGLIRGCLAHFEERATLTKKTLSSSPASKIEFLLERISS